jgi:hypothetical protein
MVSLFDIVKQEHLWMQEGWMKVHATNRYWLEVGVFSGKMRGSPCFMMLLANCKDNGE